tara:strand:+ start:943 stop:1218 length:276 start_codon:yes stop_codon:yes gene_type:complete
MDRTNIRQVFIKGVLPNSRSKVYQLDLNMQISEFKKYLFNEFKIKEKFYYLTAGTKCIYDEYLTFKEFNKKNSNTKIENDSHIWVKIRGSG